MSDGDVSSATDGVDILQVIMTTVTAMEATVNGHDEGLTMTALSTAGPPLRPTPPSENP